MTFIHARRNMVNAMSSKAEVALQAYEDEYARHLKLVSKSVENARKGIERGWEEIGITAEAEERRDFEFKFQAFLAPDHELDALNLVRSELVCPFLSRLLMTNHEVIKPQPPRMISQVNSARPVIPRTPVLLCYRKFVLLPSMTHQFP